MNWLPDKSLAGCAGSAAECLDRSDATVCQRCHSKSAKVSGEAAPCMQAVRALPRGIHSGCVLEKVVVPPLENRLPEHKSKRRVPRRISESINREQGGSQNTHGVRVSSGSSKIKAAAWAVF